MRYINFYVEYEDDYFKYADNTTDEQIQNDFENWLNGAVTYGWYEVDPMDLPYPIYRELHDQEPIQCD